MQLKKQRLEPNMEQQTGSKLGKEYIKAVYYHPACLTYMQSTSCEMLGRMKHKLKSRLQGGINDLICADDTTIMAGSKKELKSLLMKMKEESEKAGLRLNIQKMKISAYGPITSWQIDGEAWRAVVHGVAKSQTQLNDWTELNSFQNLEPVCCSMFGSNYCFLTCIQVSQEAGKVVW